MSEGLRSWGGQSGGLVLGSKAPILYPSRLAILNIQAEEEEEGGVGVSCDARRFLPREFLQVANFAGRRRLGSKSCWE